MYMPAQLQLAKPCPHHRQVDDGGRLRLHLITGGTASKHAASKSWMSTPKSDGDKATMQQTALDTALGSDLYCALGSPVEKTYASPSSARAGLASWSGCLLPVRSWTRMPSSTSSLREWPDPVGLHEALIRPPNDVTMLAASPRKCTAYWPWAAALHVRHDSPLYVSHRQALQRLQGAAANPTPSAQVHVQDFQLRAAAQQRCEVDVSAVRCAPFELNVQHLRPASRREAFKGQEAANDWRYNLLVRHLVLDRQSGTTANSHKSVIEDAHLQTWHLLQGGSHCLIVAYISDLQLPAMANVVR
jgi:hypothetical protein